MQEEQERLRKQKYLYIMQHTAENGYDTTKFNQFLNDRYSKITF